MLLLAGAEQLRKVWGKGPVAATGLSGREAMLLRLGAQKKSKEPNPYWQSLPVSPPGGTGHVGREWVS